MKYILALVAVLIVISACAKPIAESSNLPEYVDIPNLKVPEFQDIFKTLHEYSGAYSLSYKDQQFQQIQSFKGSNAKFETIGEKTTTTIYAIGNSTYACSTRPILDCYSLSEVDLGPVFNLYSNPSAYNGTHTKNIQISDEIGYCYLITGGSENWAGCFTSDGILLGMANADDSLKMTVIAVSRTVNATEFDLPTKPKVADVKSVIGN